MNLSRAIFYVAPVLATAVGFVVFPGGTAQADDVAYDIPEVLELTGVVRDFRGFNTGGHVDFENKNPGFSTGNVAITLGSEGNPVYTGNARSVQNHWRDSGGRNIAPHMYDAALGDQAGSYKATNNGGGVNSAATFDQWYNDVPGTNMSVLHTVQLQRQGDGTYLCDFTGTNQFFPVDGALFGNEDRSHNYHFTFELHTEFTYDADGQQVFAFSGDDDVWVFINNKLVIDLGGVHGQQDQFVDLNRLGLKDGDVYPLDFFFAERHTTKSNFRIQTNINLESTKIPSVTAAFD